MQKKRTEVIFGFESHSPATVPKYLPYMKQADVILLETPEERVSEFLDRRNSAQWLAAKTDRPKYTEREINALRELDKGKTIMGTDYFGEKSLAASLKEERRSDKLWQRFGGIGGARKEAIRDEAREVIWAKWLESRIEEFEGKKIYIQAGAARTPLYHMLKKKLEDRGAIVSRVHLDEGKFGPGIKQMYSPKDYLRRAFRFKTASSEDWGKARELLRQRKRFYKSYGPRYLKHYEDRSLSEEEAVEKALFEALEEGKWKEKKPKRFLRRK